MNEILARGELDTPGLFPRLAQLQASPYIFKMDFGMKTLPLEPGMLLIRGARQYGKSTWLEQQLYHTVQQFGGSSAFYLNGEYLLSTARLEQALQDLIPAFSKHAAVKRIFIDEITAIPHWELVLKRMVDSGLLAEVLVVTTGSKATDLRRGAEKLPGRKGKLARTNYLFTPVSYREFHRVCYEHLQEKTLISYLLSGGSPIACTEIATQGIIPEYIIQLVRDWVDGEIAATGRSRSALLNIMEVIFRFAGTPVGQLKLAREAGLANNSVAHAYIEILNDLGCVVPAYPWDQHRKNLILRKPCKYQITNVLSALAYHPQRIRSIEDFLILPEKTQGLWYEWLIAQELQRRAALQGEALLAPLAFWQNKEHEIDFVVADHEFIEVKRGKSTALHFGWFTHQFPGEQLTVINSQVFATSSIQGIMMEDFLLQVP